MGRKCGVKGCQSDSQRQEDLGVTFHKVPLHPDIRPKWLQLCQISDEKKVIYVCSRHFLRADFCNFKGKKYMLKQGVLPSIFSWNKVKPKNIENQLPPAFPTMEEPIKSETQSENDMEFKQQEIFKDVIEGHLTQPLSIKTEPLDIKEEMLSPNSTTIEQKIKTVNTSTGALTFVPNTRIEALDFKQNWRPATVLEVDYEENEVLVHFDMYSSKYDEWICINSNSIRALTSEDIIKKSADVYEEGERCMASWSDARKFPATVTKVIDLTTYEVLFDDGYVKTLKAHRMSKNSSTSPQSSPLFQPVTGTKEDRRNKKRKINVTSLFKKRSRVSGSQEQPPLEIQLEEPEIKKEIKEDIPEHWYPSWKNDLPVGVDSYLFMSDGYRKSVVVPDPRLPENWEKHMTQRPFGHSAGKWDTIIVTPEGKKLRLRSEVKQYIEDNPHLNLSDSMFDFMVFKPKRKKRSTAETIVAQTFETTKEATPPPLPQPPEELLHALKIIQVDGGYKCPIEGCGKNFRRENLAQMHVKHYHPKYTKFLDSTPNVADLAYARTVGENLDRSPGPGTPRDARVRVKTATPKTSIKLEPVDGTSAISESMKDSEIIKLLNSKPFDAIKTMESSSNEPLPSGLPPNMYPDIKLKDLLVKSEPVPKNNDLNLKTLSSSTTRPTGIKTLLPVRKEDDGEPRTKPSQRRDSKRKRIASETNDIMKPMEPPPLLPGIVDPGPLEYPPIETNNIIIEGGEVIKIVRMKQEEIINCTCGITEEDGLMIQCELCLCWQHAYCNNIQKENEVPEKYICYICQHPARQRNSKKYMHDQDWLKNGTLPTANYHCKDEEGQSKRFEKLKVSHDLSGGLLELKDFMHSLKLKIKIAEAKNHPKLYLWSKPWDKLPLPEKQETKIKEESTEASSEDHNGDSMLLSLLKSSKDETKIKDDEFPKLDINTLIENNLDQMNAPNIPQPEAAIESADCRLNLLEHIVHCHNLVEERLCDFEKQINELDSSLINDNDENYTRIRHSTSMLLRDLNALKELSQVTSF